MGDDGWSDNNVDGGEGIGESFVVILKIFTIILGESLGAMALPLELISQNISQAKCISRFSRSFVVILCHNLLSYKITLCYEITFSDYYDYQ